MKNTVRTTISLPEDTYLAMKHYAIDQKQTFNELVVRTLESTLPLKLTKKQTKSILDLAGIYAEEYQKDPIDLDRVRDYIDYSDL